jgi:hypothetical protein
MKIMKAKMKVKSMYGKSYKLLIIWDFQITILHVPKRNNGIMEWWNNVIKAFHAVICQGRILAAKQAVFQYSAVRVYLPEGRHPIIPIFQHSTIPINCERSELSSK